jgi:hypothetical protein
MNLSLEHEARSLCQLDVGIERFVSTKETLVGLCCKYGVLWASFDVFLN